jgi:diaminopimelate epimerase
MSDAPAPDIGDTGSVRLTKHHGLGNDFLVLLDPPAGLDPATLARRACDRHRGIGADGLLVGWPGTDGADVTMELRNADGGRAEMSGNGIRCFAQAVWERTPGDVLVVATDAGPRTVRRIDEPRHGFLRVAVEMGPVKVVGDAPDHVQGSVVAAALVDAGNPHLVILDPGLATVDVGWDGPRIEAMFPDGVNVEWIWPGPGPDELTLRVWERGAGETEACGTGSWGAGAGASWWGRTGRRAVVHNPGGDVIVEIGDTALLTGPAAKIADVEWPWP